MRLLLLIALLCQALPAAELTKSVKSSFRKTGIPAAWTPATSHAGIWHDFSDTSTLTLDETGTTTIAAITNKGDGNGAPGGQTYFDMPMSGTTKSLQPVYVHNYLNGNSVAYLDGTKSVNGGAANASYIFGNGTVPYNDWVWIFFVKPNAGSSLRHLFAGPGLEFHPMLRWESGQLKLNEVGGPTITAAVNNNFQFILVHIHRPEGADASTVGGSVAMYINGVLIGQGEGAGTQYYKGHAGNIFGWGDSTSYAFSGWIGEHAFFRNKTAADILPKALEYGQNKWEIP